MMNDIQIGAGEKRSEYAAISQIAHMYYNLNMSQPEIAEKMFFSRSTVSRILKRARELGIVEIKVHRIYDRATTVEEKLKAHFGLKEAVVVTNFEDSDENKLDIIAEFAASFVAKNLTSGCVFGISNGNTVTKVVECLPRINVPHLDVVQLMGSTAHPNVPAESRELVGKIASIYPSRCFFLNTPIFVEDLYVKNALLQDRTVQETLQKMKHCSLLLTGIGEVRSGSSSGPDDYLTPAHHAELVEKGAVGRICAQYYDMDGQLIPCQWNLRCIAMPFPYLRSTPVSIGVASGKNKVRPCLGALRGRLLNVFITDIDTALSILAEEESLNPPLP